MSTVPPTNIGKLNFYEQHIPVWMANVLEIGLEAQSIVDLSAMTTEARDKYTALLAARSASKAATTAFNEAVAAMHGGPGAGADMIKQIRVYALSTDNPQVYALAEIPAPAEPSPPGPPARPSQFTAGLRQDGAIVLTWKATNPAGASGTSYEVMRRIGSAPFEYLGPAEQKSFIDATVPSAAAGAAGGVTYQVTGVRSGIKGAPGQFVVNFGAGGQAVSFTEDGGTNPVKLAA